MKYAILLLSLLMVGCTTDKALVISNAKKLCACQGGLWWIDGSLVKCNNGTLFFDVEDIEVFDVKCNTTCPTE